MEFVEIESYLEEKTFRFGLHMLYMMSLDLVRTKCVFNDILFNRLLLI